jgi:hypothetical protein
MFNDEERSASIRIDTHRYPHIVTVNNIEPTNVKRALWCIQHFGSIYRGDPDYSDSWTYWNEQYVGGSQDKIMYMFNKQKDAMLFKLRWLGAKR